MFDDVVTGLASPDIVVHASQLFLLALRGEEVFIVLGLAETDHRRAALFARARPAATVAPHHGDEKQNDNREHGKQKDDAPQGQL